MYEYGFYCIYMYTHTRTLHQVPRSVTPPPLFFLYVKLLRSGHISGMCFIISTHGGLISYFVEGNMTVS